MPKTTIFDEVNGEGYSLLEANNTDRDVPKNNNNKFIKKKKKQHRWRGEATCENTTTLNWKSRLDRRLRTHAEIGWWKIENPINFKEILQYIN